MAEQVKAAEVAAAGEVNKAAIKGFIKVNIFMWKPRI